MADFAQTIATAYATDGAAADLGRGVHDGAVVPEAAVSTFLKSKEGKKLQQEVVRGVFGMLKKRLGIAGRARSR